MRIIILTLFCLVFCNIGISQKKANEDWQDYSPSGALFTLSVPSKPLIAQGHIFDPETEKTAYRLFKDANKSRVFNFEIHKNEERGFLVSILQLSVVKKASRTLSDETVEIIKSSIGDGVENSVIDKSVTTEEATFRWNYRRTEGMRSNDEYDGVVVVKIASNKAVIMVVDFDFACAEDSDVTKLLDSLHLKNK